MSLASVVSAAIDDFTLHGYDSQTRLDFWTAEIRKAAAAELTPPHMLEMALRDVLGASYRKMVDNAGLLKWHRGVQRFTLEQVRPRLRAELDRRILASANLIKLNRQAAIEKTLQRFQGWSTSIPVGGSRIVEKRDEKTDILKSVKQLRFEERRVTIDQSHKFAAALSDILATDAKAIAAIWHHHHVRYPRAEHLARDGHIFLIRDSWAHEKGFVKPGADGYADEIERPAEWVYCRCSYQYLYNLRDLPHDMITDRGRAELQRVRALIAA